MGDHTDYLGGLALPMAIDLGTTVVGRRCADRVRLGSADVDGRLDLARRRAADLAPTRRRSSPAGAATWPRWSAEIDPATGSRAASSTTLPIGAGLSSSAALEVAVALALGDRSHRCVELAQACQRAEHRASGVPVRADGPAHRPRTGWPGTPCSSTSARSPSRPVAVPDVDRPWWWSTRARRGDWPTRRTPSGGRSWRRPSARSDRSRDAALADLAAMGDRSSAGRARHVITENDRVPVLRRRPAGGDRATRRLDHAPSPTPATATTSRRRRRSSTRWSSGCGSPGRVRRPPGRRRVRRLRGRGDRAGRAGEGWTVRGLRQGRRSKRSESGATRGGSESTMRATGLGVSQRAARSTTCCRRVLNQATRSPPGAVQSPGRPGPCRRSARS